MQVLLINCLVQAGAGKLSFGRLPLRRAGCSAKAVENIEWHHSVHRASRSLRSSYLYASLSVADSSFLAPAGPERYSQMRSLSPRAFWPLPARLQLLGGAAGSPAFSGWYSAALS